MSVKNEIRKIEYKTYLPEEYQRHMIGVQYPLVVRHVTKHLDIKACCSRPQSADNLLTLFHVSSSLLIEIMHIKKNLNFQNRRIFSILTCI